jgi:hypothetical protein
VVLDQAPDLTQPHDITVCDGTCKDPFHKGFMLELAHSTFLGKTWGDLVQTWDERRVAQMGAAERAKLEAAQREAEAKAERLAPLFALRKQMMDGAKKKQMQRNLKGNDKKRVLKPCFQLYSPEVSHKTKETALGTHRHVSEPTTLGISSECWAHEFTDPLTYEFVDAKTGKVLPMGDDYRTNQLIAEGKVYIKRNGMGEFVLIHKVHCCWNLHPGDSEWKPVWFTNRLDDGRPANGSNWRTAGAAAPAESPPPAPAPPTNPWGAKKPVQKTGWDADPK